MSGPVPFVAPVLLPLLVGLPGILGLGLLQRSREELGSLTWLFLAICLGVLIVGLEGVLLASLSLFRPIGIATSWGAACLLLWSLNRRPGCRLPAPSISRWDWLALALLLVTALLFSPPHENVIVGRDPGVYMNTGIHLARTGQWVIEEPFLNALPGETRTAFDVDRGPHLEARMFGFFWLSDRDQVVSQFLPFYTVWIALLEMLLGPGGGQWAALLFTLIAGLGLYSLAASFWRPRAGIAALLLMAVNPAILWNARSANAEVALRVLLLFLVALWQGRQAERPTWASALVFAGTLAAAVLTKLDMLYMLPAVILLFGLSWLGSPAESYYRRAAALSVLSLAAAGVFLVHLAEPYLIMQFRIHSHDSLLVALSIALIAMGALLLQLLVVAFALPRLAGRLAQRYRAWLASFDGLSRRWQYLVGAGLAVCIVFLGYVLPLGAPELNPPSKRLTFARATWYVTPVAWWLAGLGSVSLLRRRPSRGELLLLALLAASMALNLSLYMVDHVWTARRFMPIAIPAVLLLAAGGLNALTTWRPRRAPVLGWVLAIALGATMLGGQALKSAVLWPHREFPGTRQFLADLAGRFSPGAVILIDPEDILGYRSILASFIGPHLWLQYDLQPLYMARALTEDDWQAVQLTASEQGRDLYYIGEIKPPMAPDVDSVALERFSWDIEALERTLDRFPSGIETFHFEFSIWRLLPGSGVMRYTALSLPTQIGELWTNAADSFLQSCGAPGFISFGPYHKFPKGEYVARFVLESADSSPVEVRLDATPVGKESLAQTVFTLLPQVGAQIAELRFVIADGEIADTPLEVRALLSEGGVARLYGLQIVPAKRMLMLRGAQ
ncbi:MAG: hypothetical protein FJZ90_07390 [Chloroflexi bacterium]|nr:hypothetical protein [Chloroflexota bacterium]